MLKSDPLKSVEERLLEIDRSQAWFSPRRQIMHDLRAMLERIDRRRFEELQRRYAELVRTSDPEAPCKYLDIPLYVWVKLMLARELGLTKGSPRRVLDIGTGGGHFPFVCRFLGHDAIGIDIDYPLYQDIAACLGVQRTIMRVEPGASLPDLGGKFDLITAYGVTFNDREDDAEGRRRYWSLKDWKFFFDDILVNQLRYPGALRLELNPEYSGGALNRDRLAFNGELLQMASRMGAVVDRKRGTIDMSFASRAGAMTATAIECAS